MSDTKQKTEIIDITNETLGANKTIFQRFSKRVKDTFTYQIPRIGNDYKEWITSFRGAFIVFVFIIFTLMMFLINSLEYFNVFIIAMIFSIFAASWDLLSGVTGQVSFGHAAFFGIGGYAFSILITFYTNVNIIWLMLISAFITVIFGLIIAVPSLRLKGPYLALGTLAFSMIFFYLLQQPQFNELIISLFPQLFPPLDELDQINHPLSIRVAYRGNLQFQLIFVLVIMVISITTLLLIYNSKLGTIFKGIRDDENAIKASGINTWKYKLFAFMISAFFAGIAGVLYSLNIGQVTYSEFSTTLSFFPVIFAILGGIAQISGAVLGAFMFVFIKQIIQEVVPIILDVLSLPFIDKNAIILSIDVLSLLIFAIILIFIIRFTEHGLMEPLIKKSKIFWDLVSGK